MNVVSYTGREDLAVVYLAETTDGRAVEFVEALQPAASQRAEMGRHRVHIVRVPGAMFHVRCRRLLWWQTLQR